MTYNELLMEAEKENLYIFENENIGRCKGLSIDNTISLSRSIRNVKEKKCVLAEELGHYKTTYGNILNQNNMQNIKEENKGRAWAYEKLVSFEGLINAFEEGVKNRYELSLFLEVTEKFLINAIKYYRRKYGIYHKYECYVIYFEPLGILKKEDFK